MLPPRIALLLPQHQPPLARWISEMLLLVHTRKRARIVAIAHDSNQRVGSFGDPLWWWGRHFHATAVADDPYPIEDHLTGLICSCEELYQHDFDILLVIGTHTSHSYEPTQTIWKLMGCYQQEYIDTCTAQIRLEQLSPQPKTLACVNVSQSLISPQRSLNQRLWKSTSMLSHALEEYTHTQPHFIDSTKPICTRAKRNSLIHGVQQLHKLTHYEQWCVAYKKHTRSCSVSSDFTFLQPPKGHHWADPFAVERKDKTFIFIEELLPGQKGRIAFIELHSSGHYTAPQTIIEGEFHLSYPFIFFARDTLWMIPECSASKHIQLYRCTQFPDIWTHECDLISNIHALDPSLIKIGDYWWLFVTIKEHYGAPTTEDLSLFYSKSFKGPWKQHRQKRIRSTPRGSRCAGRPFQLDGRWFRPAQDCRESYGNAVIVQQIDELTPNTYKEHEAYWWKPHIFPKSNGLHTLNYSQNHTFIDIRRWQSRIGL